MTFQTGVASPRRTVVYGLAIGVAIGATATTGWWYWRRRQRHALLKQLAEHTRNDDFDPDKHSMDAILNELQLVFDLPNGGWNDETEAQIRKLLAEPAQAEPVLVSTTVNPTAELEPDENWEVAYSERIDGAVAQALAEPDVVTFDQAVIYILMATFPESGAFHANPAMGAWKQQARERTRQDLARRVGYTEAEARAALNAQTAGAAALQQGLGLGQAVRSMGEYAFPTATWTGGPRADWQRLFSDRAASELARAQDR